MTQPVLLVFFFASISFYSQSLILENEKEKKRNHKGKVVCLD